MCPKKQSFDVPANPSSSFPFLHRAYDSAEQDDLWDFLTRAAHQDSTLPKDMTVKTIMDTWTLQMGYPVIKVTRSVDGTATVTQVMG